MVTDTRQFDMVSPAAVRRWCATLDINDLSATIAPQAFHWCLCLPEALTSTLGSDGHPNRVEPDAALFPRRMWAASSVEFIRSLPIGAAIERRSRVMGESSKSGSSGKLKFLEIEHLLLADGHEAVRERQTLVFLGAAPAAKEVSEKQRIEYGSETWEWRRSLVPRETLLFRYSAMTFNSHRIHYDYPYARQVEGYPALVVHAPLLATLLVDLCRCNLGNEPLASFSFRARAPAFAGNILHLVGRVDGGSVTLAALDADGDTLVAASAVARE
jgi:3-methylfumaryl-CoA hydratase